MPDDLRQRGTPDRNKINVNQAWEVTRWAGELGVSEAQLRAAVQAVGPMVADVRRRLGK
jgi:hypothetical protein